MKFYISRTSDPFNENSPCDNAILLNPNRDVSWENPIYGIEINSLEELMELKNKVGDIIISEAYYDDISYSPYEIEIYDDYRE